MILNWLLMLLNKILATSIILGMNGMLLHNYSIYDTTLLISEKARLSFNPGNNGNDIGVRSSKMVDFSIFDTTKAAAISKYFLCFM